MDEFEFQPEPFEAFAKAEDYEAFDTELADEEWEDEFRRFGRMPSRARPPRTRGAPRRPQPQRQKIRPTQYQPLLPKRPLLPPKRPPRLARRGGWPIDSLHQPVNSE